MEQIQRVLLGITGGIAAYKMPELVRLLAKNGVTTKVVLSPNARFFVTEETLRTVSDNFVYCDSFTSQFNMAHIELAKWAQIFLICPATANTIAKIACGIADNLLTTLALSFDKRMIIVPAMNSAMWQNSITQKNISILKEKGCFVLPVDEGELACGERGVGRLLPLNDIVNAVLNANFPKVLSNKKVLISCGPTLEPIDDVRVITNLSSGKMGIALSYAALNSGAEVCVVCGPCPDTFPSGCRVIRVNTALEMKASLDKEFKNSDVCIMAAAVADFKPQKTIKGKIHRNASKEISLKLIPNPDILMELGKIKKEQIIVGFSLESKLNINNAQSKMKSKNCDIMVVNTIKSSIGKDKSEAAIIYGNKKLEKFEIISKQELANKIILAIAEVIRTKQ